MTTPEQQRNLDERHARESRQVQRKEPATRKDHVSSDSRAGLWLLAGAVLVGGLVWQANRDDPEPTQSPSSTVTTQDCSYPMVCAEDCHLYGDEPTLGTADWDYWRTGFGSDSELYYFRTNCGSGPGDIADYNIDTRDLGDSDGVYDPSDDSDYCGRTC